jgi:2-keto-4-pentenoate hydratase/2-oxohepta-3-ene-1,7-dioic acid hydratase in catechol pathway
VNVGRMNTEDGVKYCEIGEDYVAVIEGDIFSDRHDVGPRRSRQGVELLMPLAPSKLLIVLGAFPGARTLEEAREQPPKLTGKMISSMIADGETVVVPSWAETPIYAEPEIAVVIGKTVKDASPEEASAAIFGYTAFNDITLLDAVWNGGDFFKAKSLDTFGAIGSWVTTDVTEKDVAAGLALRCFVNDELVHQGNTKLFTHSVAETVSQASRLCTLFPGDIISLGTPPDPEPMVQGGTVRIEVETVGSVSNPVK